MHRRFSNTLLLLVTLLPVTSVVLADIYQCQNTQGKMQYKDTPCSEKENEILKITQADIKIQPETHTSNANEQNLVKNPSFENKLVGWNAQQNTQWQANQGQNSNAAVSIQAKKPPMDKYIYETTVHQCVKLGAGTRYSLAASFKLETFPKNKHANRTNLIWYESVNCTTGGQFGNYLEPENKIGWQKLSRENLMPALHAKAAKIVLTQNGRYSNGGKVLWDNILLVATEFKPKSIVTNRHKYTLGKGINYLSNGAFNAKLDDWQISSKTKWSQFIGHTEPGSARVTSYSSNGGRGSGAFTQCANIGENTKFELGASFKNDPQSTAPGNGRLRITWYQDLNCKGPAKTDSNWKDPEPIDGWQKLHITGLVAPKDSQSAIIEVIQAIHEEGYFYAYWDDLYFRATQ